MERLLGAARFLSQQRHFDISQRTKTESNVLELHCIRKCSSWMVEPMLKAALCILFISLVNV
ncbi:hypothetical protein Peur_000415 [Populus x canadensis]